MKILIIGGGGREHALAWRLAKSPDVTELIAAPGNPGIETLATCISLPQDVGACAALAEQIGATLTVVGPEAPLVKGIVDQFKERKLSIIGPTQSAARLEGSKIFAKQFFERAGIPTARSVQVTSTAEATEALKKFGFPVVIKADGLAGGKGVIIAQSEDEAQSAMGHLGPALVIEEFLDGEEISFIGLSDGENLYPFPPSQDHKRAYDGDEGPNTGGMGAVCDPKLISKRQADRIMDEIMLPAITRMRKEDSPFTGFLYAGLMMTADGPRVLEFNVRMGDPETQAILRSFDADFAEFLVSPGNVKLKTPDPSACVVLAAEGYPDTPPRSGDPITGIVDAEETGAVVFQAGTRKENGVLTTASGRVLGVTASGENLDMAISAAYKAVDRIGFRGMQYRKDIGRRALKRC